MRQQIKDEYGYDQFGLPSLPKRKWAKGRSIPEIRVAREFFATSHPVGPCKVEHRAVIGLKGR
jgi:hypothetical protein